MEDESEIENMPGKRERGRENQVHAISMNATALMCISFASIRHVVDQQPLQRLNSLRDSADHSSLVCVNDPCFSHSEIALRRPRIGARDWRSFAITVLKSVERTIVEMTPCVSDCTYVRLTSAKSVR